MMKNLIILITSILLHINVYSQGKSDEEYLKINNMIEQTIKLKKLYEAHLFLQRHKDSDLTVAALKRGPYNLTDKDPSEYLEEYQLSILELKNSKELFYKYYDTILASKKDVFFIYDFENPFSSVLDSRNRLSYAMLLKIIDKYLFKKNEDLLPIPITDVLSK